MRTDLRAVFAPRVIAWLVVGIVGFVFKDEIKGILDAVLPTDVRGLALMLLVVLVMLAFILWPITNEVHEIREKLLDVDRLEIELHDKLLDVQVEQHTAAGNIARLENEAQQLREELLSISDMLHNVRDSVGRLEERRNDQQAQLSDLLRLIQGVLLGSQNHPSQH